MLRKENKMGPGSGFCGNQFDFHQVARGQVCSDAGAAGPAVIRNPVAPDGIHVVFFGHIRQIDRGFQYLVFVAAGFVQVLFHQCQHITCLLGNVVPGPDTDNPYITVMFDSPTAAFGVTGVAFDVTHYYFLSLTSGTRQHTRKS